MPRTSPSLHLLDLCLGKAESAINSKSSRPSPRPTVIWETGGLGRRFVLGHLVIITLASRLVEGDNIRSSCARRPFLMGGI